MISFLKNTKDIEKSCNNMIKTMKDKMFRMRCYGKNMSYFITSYTKSPPPFFLQQDIILALKNSLNLMVLCIERLM